MSQEGMSGLGADVSRLDRFLKAQTPVQFGVSFDTALAELKQGRKHSCWIWYVFPQFLDPGRPSERNQKYQIHSRHEATAYLLHPVLGPRYIEIAEVVACQLGDRPVRDLMGGFVDAKKLHQSMTVFYLAAKDAGMEKEGELFGSILDQIFERPYLEGIKKLDHHMLQRWEDDDLIHTLRLRGIKR